MRRVGARGAKPSGYQGRCRQEVNSSARHFSRSRESSTCPRKPTAMETDVISLANAVASLRFNRVRIEYRSGELSKHDGAPRTLTNRRGTLSANVFPAGKKAERFELPIAQAIPTSGPVRF